MSRLLRGAVVAWLCALHAATAHATAVELRNTDPADMGLNDPTPASAVGGNEGQSLGAQRIAALEYAAEQWATALVGDSVIRIDVSFAPTTPCQVGGMAEVTDWVLDEPGLEPDVLYPVTLAEHLLGRELNDTSDADILLSFNATPCSNAPSWYLGLDDAAPPGSVSVITAALHELAHGLGLSSTLNAHNGEPAVEDTLDVFSRNIYDSEADKAWIDMNADELARSVTRQRQLVWLGEAVATVAAQRLDAGWPRIEVTPPIPGFAAELSETDAPPWLNAPLIERLRVASPADLCESQPNNGIPSIMLASPGLCTLHQQAENAAAGGAVALLVASPEDVSPPPTLRSGDHRRELALPVLTVTRADTDLLLDNTGSTVTLSSLAERRLGADELARPYIHVAEPALQGSNLSHWDAMLRPSALLEPTIVADAPFLDIEMEKAALRDIGWDTTPCAICSDNSAPNPESSRDAGHVVDAGPTDDAGHRRDAEGHGDTPSSTDTGPLGDAGQQRVDGNDAAASAGDNETTPPSPLPEAGSTRDAALSTASAMADAAAVATPANATRRVSDETGCACTAVPPAPPPFGWLMTVAAALCGLRRRRFR